MRKRRTGTKTAAAILRLGLQKVFSLSLALSFGVLVLDSTKFPKPHTSYSLLIFFLLFRECNV